MPEIRVPFSGFYCSIWSDNMDHCDESTVSYLTEEHPDLPEDVRLDELLLKHTDYHNAMLKISELYVNELRDYLIREHKLFLFLMFKDMSSPKEYNFQTDRIFADIPDDDVLRLFNYVNKDALTEVCKKQFTSRSGFISFYDADWTTWGDVLTWDHNQLWTLLETIVSGKEFEEWLGEDLWNDVDAAVDASRDWNAILHELKMIEENIPDDGRKYPHSLAHDIKMYVKKFLSDNNYKE